MNQNLTVQELKAMFTSCDLSVVHLDQGQVPRYKDQPVECNELIVKNLESSDRSAYLSAMRKQLKNYKRKVRRATRDAFTYGGTFIESPSGMMLVMTIAIAQRQVATE